MEPVFAPVVEEAGFRLVRLRILGGANKTLQIMAERPDGQMDVEGCAALSHALVAFIEKQDPLEGDYTIEVSSPGIDRPLSRPADFSRWAGYEAKIALNAPQDGRKHFRGLLEGFDGDEVVLSGRDGRVRIAFSAIADAKLVLTDKLIRESLKAHERASKEKKNG